MRPFDLATWTSVIILVAGALLIFVWFLRDAGKVLRGDGTLEADERDPNGGGSEDSR
jgi:hypothetical protein